MNLNPVYTFLGGLAIGVVGGLYLAQKLIQKDYDERLEAEIDAVRTSRDTFQRQNAELMKQVRLQQKQIKRLGG